MIMTKQKLFRIIVSEQLLSRVSYFKMDLVSLERLVLTVPQKIDQMFKYITLLSYNASPV